VPARLFAEAVAVLERAAGRISVLEERKLVLAVVLAVVLVV
jgi:hypothetical protein